MTFYATVNGGRSCWSVEAETRELAAGVAQGMILNPNPETHPGFFFELRDNPAGGWRDARNVVIYTPQEWLAIEHALMVAEGRAIVGADGRLHLNKQRWH